ncbi:coiled-coil domain-containing protein 93 [Cricetulus griseus]|nr:coiled-coil domain-containing protein 93 [Cricetulus griseus]
MGLPKGPEGQGLPEVETREDEEQNVKLTEILELLVAAGYFRARIKGLSPFDKWLVKRAIETKEEMGDYIRSYSISQFQKTYSLPEDDDFIKRKDKAIKTIIDLSDTYKPRRKYRRQQGAEELLDEESRVHSTLLEYGRRYGFSRHNKTEKAEDKKTALAAGLSATEKTEAHEEDELQAAEEKRIQSLMTKMTAMANEESRLTASSVGQIVGLCSAEIKQIVSEYAGKQSELSAEESPEKLGTSQLHQRKVISLNKQILQKTKHLEELQTNHSSLQAKYSDMKKTLTELKNHGEKLDKEQAALEKLEAKADPSILQSLRALVAMNENLKSQEQEFKAHCREEMARLQQEIETLKAERTPGEKTDGEPHGALTPTMTHSEDLDRRYNMEKEKLYKIRLLQARRNREIAILHRKIDEVPSRAELIQYQKRFIELYRQISAVHKETKQFFTLYNTLDDRKVYLEKEMEKKKQENKMRRDQLNDQYLELLEKQRLYFKTVKEFKEEGRKNELLLSKIKAKAS